MSTDAKAQAAEETKKGAAAEEEKKEPVDKKKEHDVEYADDSTKGAVSDRNDWEDMWKGSLPNQSWNAVLESIGWLCAMS